MWLIFIHFRAIYTEVIDFYTFEGDLHIYTFEGPTITTIITSTMSSILRSLPPSQLLSL